MLILRFLDEPVGWARVLTTAEIQWLSFEQIIRLYPRWILLGDVKTALHPASADLMKHLIVERLPQSGNLLIWRPQDRLRSSADG